MAKPLYLGKKVNSSGELGEPFFLEGDQLVTHGVVLGMTGSGKTGLSMTLLEELVGAGVPLILIDPKGDLPNLSLLFPEMEPSQFEPWVDPQEAQRQGLSSAQLAQEAASRLKQNLTAWGLSSEKMASLRQKMQLKVFTPGATAGIPINLLGSFDPPDGSVLPNSEARNELLSGTVAGLLSLVGVQADPLRSPEHIVLATILDQAWTQGEKLSLETLIIRLVDPPFKKVGVFPLDTFYPADKRMDLAMRLNSVLASPSFSLWTQGESLDPSRWCTPRDGKTPVSVFYMAHLSDQERMFFVSLLCERVLAYSRTLSGTTALRSLVYFDEVAGYLPPHPLNPPSKRPLLTLMKQARAVGFGVILATQNPVDIDYKGLANAGTWMIGRMQTAQDRERVADGLVSAAAGVDRATLISYFEQLKPRVFMVKSAAAERPELIHTRQAMSFLRGPLTRADLERLDQPRVAPTPTPTAADQPGGDNLLSHPPVVPKGFDQLFVDPRVVFSARLEGAFEKFAEDRRPDGKVRMKPAIFAELHLRFDDDKGGFVHDEHLYRIFYPIEEGLPKVAFTVLFEDGDLLTDSPTDGLFQALPAVIDEAHELKAAQKALLDEVYRNVTESQFVHTGLKLYGAGGESREDFEGRVRQAIQARIDQQVAKLHDKYDRQLAALQDKISKVEARSQELQTQAEGRHTEQLWNAGAAIMGFFTGSRRSVTSAISKTVSGALTKNRLSEKAQKQSEAAQEELARLQEKLDQLQIQLHDEVQAIEEKENLALGNIEEKPVRLETSDIRVSRFGILWLPLSRRI